MSERRQRGLKPVCIRGVRSFQYLSLNTDTGAHLEMPIVPILPVAGLLCLSFVWLFSTDKKKSSGVKSQRGSGLVHKARRLLDQY